MNGALMLENAEARQPGKKPVFRITLQVRGQTIIREYQDESEFKKWQAAYRYQLRNGNGIERVECDVLWR